MINLLKENKTIKNKFSSIKRQFVKKKGYFKIKLNTKHIYGPKRIAREPLDCIVICIVKDAEIYIDRFIRYYLKSGFRHIIFMDNGSTDRTIEFASQYDRVTILRCLLSFRKNKYHMLQYLIHRYSFYYWCLIADCDEFFDYPYSEHISLEELIGYLEKNKYTAVLSQLLDMYPKHPLYPDIEENQYMKSHCWFEVDTIEKQNISPGFENKIDFDLLKLHYGGVRKRVFGVSPLLSKFSLIKLNHKLHMVGLHFVSWATVADLTCVFYHYKFAGDFYKKVKEATRSEEYYKKSYEYRCYKNILDNVSYLQLYHKGKSIRLQDTIRLLDVNLLQAGKDYRQYVSSKKIAS